MLVKKMAAMTEVRATSLFSRSPRLPERSSSSIAIDPLDPALLHRTSFYQLFCRRESWVGATFIRVREEKGSV
jgi:hypothetical protein